MARPIWQKLKMFVSGAIPAPTRSPQKVMAQAYNAQGVCFLASDRPQDALIAYLHTSELFYQDPDTHAEALYQLSKLWDVVKKSGEANRARGLLRERYGDSVWAKKQ